VRLEQQRAHGGRQSQRNNKGNDRGPDDRQRELPVELAGNAADEDRGHKHRAQHERDGNQRGADFVHAFARRFARRQPSRDIAFDVFDDDDGVVDHDADRQNQPEQGKIVQRKAERRHEEKRADERHRDGDQRNDRGAPILQKQHHHQHNQHDGFADRIDHRIDGLLDELRGIVDDGVFDAGWKSLRQLNHLAGDTFGGGDRVGTCLLYTSRCV